MTRSPRGAFPVTQANLRAVLGSDAELPLDRIKAARGQDVFPHVLAHLPDYLTALDQATGTPTIADADQFGDVLAEVGRAKTAVVATVAHRASADCLLVELDAVDAWLWPAIASAHRFALTAPNAKAYVAQHGIDAALAEYLTNADTIEVRAADSTTLGPLALEILNAKALNDDTKLRLVNGFGLEAGSIAASGLHVDGHSALPALVKGGLVADNADAFLALGDDEWAAKQALICASETFSAYMSTLALSGDDLLNIASSPVPEVVKDVLIDELDAYVNLGPRGATALATWAANNDRTPTAEAIVTMATKGSPASARAILRLVGAQASTMGLDCLKDALNALGRPYAQLTTPGLDRPKVEITDGVDAILQRLRRDNIISTVKADAKRHVFEVSKRHS